MLVTITAEQRKELLRYKRRPRTLRQYYAARTLLALGEGKPLPVVARSLRRPEAQVERWALGFEAGGVAYVARLGHRDAGPSRPSPPEIETLLRIEKRPAPEGLDLDLDADPADLY